MTYRGKVRPGGAPDVRDLANLSITKMSVGDMDNNAYLLRCQRTDEQVMIDAANEPNRLLSLIGADGLARVVTTHRHADHWQGLAAVVEATGAETVAGADDAHEIPVPITRPVLHGDTVAVGDCELEVIHLVGHTPGSIALLYDDPAGTPHLFTGDSLFPGGVGKTWSAGGLQDPARRGDHQGLRPAARRDLVLPRPRGRLHARRASAPTSTSGAPAAGER